MNRELDRMANQAAKLGPAGIEVCDGQLVVGSYYTEHWRPRKSGSGHRLLDIQLHKNLITTAGKNSWLDTMFNEDTQVVTGDWCCSLVNNAAFSAFAAADTISSHAGWAEYTSYTETNRVAWGQGSAASGSIVNSSVMTFTLGGTITIKGLFLVSENTKGGTTGLLFSESAYTSNISGEASDQIRSLYTVALS